MSQADERSLLGDSTDERSKLLELICDRLEGTATTYKGNIKVITDSIAEKSRRPFLKEAKKDDKDPGQGYLGNLLFNELEDIMSLLGIEFRTIIKKGIPFPEVLSNIQALRLEAKEKLDSLEISRQVSLIEPKLQFYELDAETENGFRVMQAETEAQSELIALAEEQQVARQREGYDEKFYKEKLKSLKNEHKGRMELVTEQNTRTTLLKKREYVLAVKEWQKKLEEKGELEPKLKSAQSKFETLSNVEVIIQALEAAATTIASTIRTEVDKYPAIKSKLSSPYTLLNTEMTYIDNPLQRLNLCAIYNSLHENYHKMSFVQFTNKLFTTLNWTPSQSEINNPLQIVSELETIQTEWHRKSLWDQLNQDVFWAALLLRALPAGTMRQVILRETMAFVKKIEKEELDGETPMSDTPIYDTVKEEIKSYVEGNSAFRLQSGGVMVDRNISKNGSNSYNTRPYATKSGSQQVQMENAAVSEEQANLVSENGKLFSGEVTDGKTIIEVTAKGNTTKKVPYYAVKKLKNLCATCFSDDNSRKEGSTCPQQRQHFTTKCSKCGMYGHHQSQCLQKL